MCKSSFWFIGFLLIAVLLAIIVFSFFVKPEINPFLSFVPILTIGVFFGYTLTVLTVKPFETPAITVVLPYAFVGFVLFLSPMAPNPFVPMLFTALWTTLPYPIALAVQKRTGRIERARGVFVASTYVSAVAVIPVVDLIFY